jgi:hypothetical protein
MARRLSIEHHLIAIFLDLPTDIEEDMEWLAGTKCGRGTTQLHIGSRLVPPPKIYTISYRMFGHMHGILNID